ncbi:hypothetical protein Clacol_007257 [Clathrus columnatus]|uniref:DUF6533 domain-containing protein n=1 Tax=Clathrus columnatus TaxID=1419009 RepID=A0AAV5AHN2_9AGAM|nr:hypothetical protein Clacol_007257 [Clathrus columnatus]
MSELEQFIQLLDDQLGPNQIVSYNTISATCLLFYEMVLTFPDELRYVWRGPVVLVPTIDILLVVRVYALYDRNKWIGLILLLFWLAETATVVGLAGSGFGPTKAAANNPLPGILPGCFPIDPFSGSNIIKGGIVAIVCQGVYFGLAMYKMARQIREFRMGTMTPLLKTFFRRAD